LIPASGLCLLFFFADALLERGFQTDRLVVLLQQVLEGFISELLKRLGRSRATASIACKVSSSNCTRFPAL
jgi:hypothetical protein